jgi:hypothetical protein
MDDEERLGVAWRELRRLFTRALARPLLTLGITAVLAGLFIVREARKVQYYSSQVVFRVSEGAAASSTPNRALRDHVRQEILSQEALLDLARRHRLGVRLTNQAVVEWLREDEIAVEVWRNHFMVSRSVEDRARSALLSLSFAHRDPKVAYEVVCDLQDLISGWGETTRIQRAEDAAARLDLMVATAREALFAARAEEDRKELQLARSRTGDKRKLIHELEAARGTVITREREVKSLEERRDADRLRAQVARYQLTTRFEVVEPPRPAALVGGKTEKLVMLGGIAFLMLLPLAAMAVGSWDSRVVHAADLRRLGIEPLGHVPGFPGDEVGSLDERMKRMRYTQQS